MAKTIGTLIFRITADTKALRKGMAQTQTQMQKIGQTAKLLAGTMAAAFAGQIIMRGISNAVRVMTTFEQSMADVRAVTRSTQGEFDRLNKLARELGGSTKFTANEVAKLEKAYAKLGFTTKEIEGVSEATLNLATATDSELGRAAEVVGGVVRGFRLQAEEAIRVTDVMGLSFSSSALDIEKFAESMKFVAPIARTVGFELEETTALLAVLADNMIDGSMAGTSLRRIFLELGGGTAPLGQKLKELAERGLTLADAEDEVGKRALTALLILTSQIDKLPKLTAAFKDAAGTIDEMARVQLDTLNGQLVILKSSWEKLILDLNTTNEGMSLAKETVSSLSGGLSSLSDNIKIVGTAFNIMLVPLNTIIKRLQVFWALTQAPSRAIRKRINRGAETGTPRQAGANVPNFVGGGGLQTAGVAGPSILGLANIAGLQTEEDILKELKKDYEELNRIVRKGINLFGQFRDVSDQVNFSLKTQTSEFPRLNAAMLEWQMMLENIAETVRMLKVELAALAIEGLAALLTGFDSDKNQLRQVMVAILSTIAGVAGQLGRILIATGIGIEAFQEALKTLNPAVAIGAGIALLALSGIAKAAIANLGRSTSGGATATSANVFQPATIQLQSVLRGPDIYLSGQRGGALIGGTT